MAGGDQALGVFPLGAALLRRRRTGASGLLKGFWERHSEEASEPLEAVVGRGGEADADRQYYPISTSLGVRTCRCSAVRGSASTHRDRD